MLRPSLIPFLACTAATALASAAPISVAHSGYLLGATDTPLVGTVALVFRAYTHPTGTTPAELAWQSDTCPVVVAGGYYATVLGDSCNSASDALSTTHLPPGAARWLEVSVAGIALSPRLPLASSPSAVAALTSADAQALKADLAAPGTLDAPTNPVAWTKLKGVPAGLADGDDDTTYTAAPGGGLSLTGQAFSLAPSGVANDRLAHDSLAVSAGAGLSGGGTVALGGTTSLALATLSPSPAGVYTHATVTVDAMGRVTSATSGSVTGGTVTSITAGTGLSGGTVTTSGTLSIANDGVTSTQLASDGASLARVTGGVLTATGAQLELRTGTSGANSELRIFKSSGADTDRASLKIGYDDAASFEIYRLRADGTIFLNAKQSGANVQFQYQGANSLTISGTNVGIGTTAPTSRLQVAGGIRAGPGGRIEYGWYQNSDTKTANYLHLKTGLWAGGAPTGNTQYIMGGFHATGYNYDGTVIDSYWMFHNWNGAPVQLVLRNQGTYPYAKGAYTSADGYIVIVADYTAASYIGATFDLIQSYAGYPWRTFGVTATSQTNSPTGAF